jgi:hypothetical protein
MLWLLYDCYINWVQSFDHLSNWCIVQEIQGGEAYNFWWGGGMSQFPNLVARDYGYFIQDIIFLKTIMRFEIYPSHHPSLQGLIKAWQLQLMGIIWGLLHG